MSNIHPAADFFREIMIFRALPLLVYDSEVLRNHDLDEELISILILIHMDSNSTLPSDVADNLFLDRSKVTRLVSRLVEKHLLSREYEAEADRRKIPLKLTEVGTEVLLAYFEERHQYYFTILKEMGNKSLEQFKQLLASFNNLILQRMQH